MGDIFDFRDIGTGILVFAHDDLLAPAHDVGIGHNAFALDHKAGATHPPNGIESPRGIPDRLLGKSKDLDNRTLRISSLANRQPAYSQQNHYNVF